MSLLLEKTINDLIRLRSQGPATDPDYSRTTDLRSVFERIDSMGGVIPVVWDHVKNDFFYLSERFFTYFGFDSDNVYREKLEFPFNRMIPIDIAIVADGAPLIWDYISNQPIDKRSQYKVVAEYRLKNDQGKDIRIQYHSVIFELTETGDQWLNLMLFEFATGQDLTTPGNISCIDVISGDYIFTSKEIKQKLFRERLSIREIEVVNLVSEGKSSKQIASQLCISENTVNNHRRKILKKLNVANSAEAVGLIKDVGHL